MRTEDLPIVMTFLISKALADPNTDVQKSVLEAGIKIIDKHRKDNISLLFLLFEDYLNKKDEAPTLVSKLLDKLMKSDKNGERRGAAFGLAGVVKGFGISCLEKYEIVITLKEAFVDRYVSQMLPLLLVSFSDQVFEVRKAAESAARAMMSQLSAQGVKLVLPSLLKGLEDKDWQTKRSSVEMLGIMADHAPQQLSQYLYMIMPKLNKVSTDTYPKVQSAGETALQQVQSVIKNPEIVTDPNDNTEVFLDILFKLQKTSINSVDAASLAPLAPIVCRETWEGRGETKTKAAQIFENMRSFVTEPKDTIPFIRLLLPGIEKLIEDKTPEGLNVVATLGSLISEMGEESFSDLDSWLLDTLQSDYSNVERSGAAQGLSEEIGSTSVHSVATTPNQPESDDRSLQTSERSTLNPFSMADLFHEGQAVIERYISNPFIIPDLLLEGRMRVPTEGYIKRCREGRHGMVWANVPCQHMVWCDSCKNEAVEAIGSIHGHTCQICGRNVEGICRRPM